MLPDDGEERDWVAGKYIMIKYGNMLFLSEIDKNQQRICYRALNIWKTINWPHLDIAELKQRLAQEARTNRGLEKELQKLESKISLLIHNRTSIQEIDRNLKKQLKKQAALAAKNTVSKEVFTNDKKKMEGYANLFYLLQTEPKYLAKV